MSLLYENTDYHSQFASGIEIIDSAFLNQSNYFQNEIAGLSNEIMIKNSKIKELEQTNASLYTEKEEYEKTIQNLLAENSRLIEMIERGKPSERTPHRAKDLEPSNQTLEMLTPSSLLDLTKATLKKNRSENTMIKPRIGSVNANGNGIGNAFRTDYLENIPKIKRSGKAVPVCIATDDDGNRKIRTSHRAFREQEKRDDFKTQPLLETRRGNDKLGYNCNKEYCNDNQESQRKKGHFFKKCRAVMTPKDYSLMIEVVRLANSYQITKQETFDRITLLLKKKYPDFIAEFEELLFPQDA